jgi:hypothetical protein
VYKNISLMLYYNVYKLNMGHAIIHIDNLKEVMVKCDLMKKDKLDYITILKTKQRFNRKK